VLLVTCDQWRADCLSCAKHPVVRTPNLDRLAADGVRFTNHFCQCVPCGPSRASLYCGMYQMNTRVISNRAPLAARHTNIANELRAAGYDPVLSGYTSTVTEQPARREGEAGLLPGMRSLNSDSGGTPEHLASSWARWLDELGYDVPAGMRFASPEITGAVLGDDPNLSDLVSRGAFTHARDARGVPVAAFYKPEHGDTAFGVNQVLSHIKHQSESSEPWACHLSLFKPHPPWLAAAPFNARYLPAEAGLPDHRRATISEEACLHPWLGQRLARGGYVAPEADDDLQLLRSQYFALCEETDSQLGRLFDELRADGSYDNTVIVMTSDHGEQLGDHWLLNKDGFFDQSYHVPLIIRCPSVVSSDTTTTHTARRGAVISAFTEHVDIMPTILECLGLPVPAQTDGSSLLPVLYEGCPPVPDGWRSAAHWEFDYSERSPPEGTYASQCSLCVLRGERWKYVQFADDSMPPLLFDMQADAGEMCNLAASSAIEHVEARANCAAQMLQWRMRHAEHTLTHSAEKGLLILEPKL
jgi:arylsulfatase A-like enzyme